MSSSYPAPSMGNPWHNTASSTVNQDNSSTTHNNWATAISAPSMHTTHNVSNEHLLAYAPNIEFAPRSTSNVSIDESMTYNHYNPQQFNNVEQNISFAPNYYSFNQGGHRGVPYMPPRMSPPVNAQPAPACSPPSSHQGGQDMNGIMMVMLLMQLMPQLGGMMGGSSASAEASASAYASSGSHHHKKYDVEDTHVKNQRPRLTHYSTDKSDRSTRTSTSDSHNTTVNNKAEFNTTNTTTNNTSTNNTSTNNTSTNNTNQHNDNRTYHNYYNETTQRYERDPEKKAETTPEKTSGKTPETTPEKTPGKTPETTPKKTPSKKEDIFVSVQAGLYGDPTSIVKNKDGTVLSRTELKKDTDLFKDMTSRLHVDMNTIGNFTYAQAYEYNVNGDKISVTPQGKVKVGNQEIAIGDTVHLAGGGTLKVKEDKGENTDKMEKVFTVEIQAPNKKGDGFENVTFYAVKRKTDGKIAYNMDLSKSHGLSNQDERVTSGYYANDFKKEYDRLSK
jgi:hypothetical protein